MRKSPKSVETPPIVDSLVQLSFAIQAVLLKASAQHNLSVTQLRLLGIVRDGEPPMSAIASHLGLDRSSVTGLVDRAEHRGLVARTASSQDARVTTVVVTPTGLEMGADLAEMVTAKIEALLGQVGEADRECLIRVATKILGAADSRPSPEHHAG
jgi:DNA-binding MarR family transcriptional regulator